MAVTGSLQDVHDQNCVRRVTAMASAGECPAAYAPSEQALVPKVVRIDTKHTGACDSFNRGILCSESGLLAGCNCTSFGLWTMGSCRQSKPPQHVFVLTGAALHAHITTTQAPTCKLNFFYP